MLRTCSVVLFFAETVLARRRGANFAQLNFQKCPEHVAWCLFFAEIVFAYRRGANFAEVNFQKCSEYAAWCLFFFRGNRSRSEAWYKFCGAQFPKVLRAYQFLLILISKSFSRAVMVQILLISEVVGPPHHLIFRS